MNERKTAIIWLGWREGASMMPIARIVHKAPVTIFSYLRYHGEIQPHERALVP